MRKVIFKAYTGYCGQDMVDIGVYPDDTPDEIISQDAWQYAVDNAETFGIEVYDENGEIVEWGVESHWEDYIPEKHDRYSVVGSFAEEFERFM